MKREELLYQRLTTYEPVAGLLTKYAGKPAVFYLEAPDDTDIGWMGEPYPRVCYTFDMRANQEQKSVGSLMVKLYCQKLSLPPERIEPELRQCLRDMLLKPDGESPSCFSWVGSSPFDIDEKGVTGSEIIFNILEYPCQETTNPDPVEAMNQYIKRFYPEACVLWFDEVEPIAITDPCSPVFYCRLENVEKDRENNTVVWMNGKIAVYLLCPDVGRRIKMMTALANRLSLDGEVLMFDRSPMFVKQLQINHQADYLTAGQLTVTVNYGLLRYPEKKPFLTETKMIYEK